MSHGKQDPFKDRREEVLARDCTIPYSIKVREIEVHLLRKIAGMDSPIAEAENLMAGGGIIVAYGLQGEVFKIEVTQVDGPK